jgi:hypothetical protein
MSASTQQRLFNRYPVHKPFNLDVWYGCSKQEKRDSTIALTYSFLLGGGQITKVAAKKLKGGRPQIFQKDTKAPAVHERWSKKYFSGDDFATKGPRFTAKPISEKSADQRDLERKAGISHSDFTGAVVDINGKLQARKASHATSEAYIDLVSDTALAASAKRDGGRHSQKIVQLIKDSGDDISDADKRATIRDRLNLNNIDHEHNGRFKLAA